MRGETHVVRMSDDDSCAECSSGRVIPLIKKNHRSVKACVLLGNSIEGKAYSPCNSSRRLALYYLVTPSADRI